MLTIRAAERRDVAAAAQLAHDAFQHYVERIGRPPAPMEADYAAAVSDGTMWVAEDGERLLGLVVLIDADDHLLVDALAVSPHSQGAGVGSRLLALAEDEAVRRGYDRTSLCTNEAMTENLAYYPRRGYVETHRAEQNGFRRVFFTKELAALPDA